MEYPVRERMDGREDERAEHRDPETMHLETLDHSAQEPEEETIDDEREDAEGQEVERQGQDEEDRLHGDVHQPPEERQDERGAEARDSDARNDVRQCEKRQSAYEPF